MAQRKYVDPARTPRPMRVTGLRLFLASLLAGGLVQLDLLKEAQANPANPAVVAGEADVSGLGTDRVTIQQASKHAIIHWAQFNIAPNEVTSFLQPVGGVALNRIFDASPSLINGSLNATGTIFLLNPNGVLFGQHAQVNVGGLVSSTLHMSDADFLSGAYRFGGASTHLGLGETAANGMVRNEGKITAGPFGAYLFAHNVENAGIIRSDGGHIALAAGTRAYLSNRSDGRGLFVEVTAPAGKATNLKDLVADGGQVSLFGRVVNHSGLIRANTVTSKNGRVELVASDAVTLTDGSRILLKGDATVPSHGGAVIAKADLKHGRTEFQKGALIDVSGGKLGGNGGFIELSASRVSWGGAFRAHASAGYRGGRLLIDPVFDGNSPITTETLSGLTEQIISGGLNDIEFQSTADMSIAAQFDLAAWLLPQGQTGTLTFNAGRNLLLNQTSITNGQRGLGTAGSRWDYKLLANEHIELTDSVLSTGSGGAIAMEAGRSPGLLGDIRLINSSGHSIVETYAGGDIRIKATGDLIAPSESIPSDSPGLETLTGIRVNGPGNLVLDVGRDWLGGTLGTIQLSPGFLVTNGTAAVKVGRNIGKADAPAHLTIGEGVADAADPFNKVSQVFKVNVGMTAGGDIFIGRVQDGGLTEGVTALEGFKLSMLTVHPDSSVFVRSAGGNISLDPRFKTPPLQGERIAGLRSYYPASFDVQAPNGSIFILSNLNFWPSITGRLNFLAKTDIQGLQEPGPPSQDPRFKIIFVGTTASNGKWELVEVAKAERDPRLAPFLNAVPPAGAGAPPVSLVAQVPLIPTLNVPPVVNLVRGDLKNLQGGVVNDVAAFPIALGQTPTGMDPNHAAQSVSFKAQEGTISGVNLNLVSEGFKKVTTIEAGRDIGVITVKNPDGTETRTGGFAASIFTHAGGTSVVSAGGNMDLAKSCDVCFSGLQFFGPGTSKVRVGSLDNAGNTKPGTGDLSLGDSIGISHQADPRSNLADQPGLLDVAVGNNLVMTRSRISTANGASVWIHGLGSKPALNGLNPSTELIVGIRENGTNRLLVDGRPVRVNGQDIILDGSQPTVSTGSVTLDHPGAQINGKSFAPVIAKGKPIFVEGKVVLLVDGQVQLADASIVSIEQGVGGKIQVGSLASGGPNGIITLRGGSIDVKAQGDIDVLKSRVATFGGGNISVSSVSGDVNAGTGGRDEAIPLIIEFGDGRPPLVFLVPGSGIFTFHPKDPKFPLNFPKFDTPEITALKGEIVKQNFLGRDTAKLEQQVSILVTARERAYREIFERFIAQNPDKPEIINGAPTGRLLPLELGDINLRAGQDLVVPTAGIRGRRIKISAGRNLDLQGGTVEGDVQFDVGGSIKGNLSSFVGAFSGSAAVGGSVSGGASAGGGSSVGGGLAGVTGTVSATASATSSTSGTASKTVESVQEKTLETSTQQARAAAEKKMAAATDENKPGSSKGLQAVKVKRGVVIQVDVKPQAQSVN
jgi:filamentous hemagglutinin family protein